MDLPKLHEQYPGSTLIPYGAFSERELQMLSRIEELESKLAQYEEIASSDLLYGLSAKLRALREGK